MEGGAALRGSQGEKARKFFTLDPDDLKFKLWNGVIEMAAAGIMHAVLLTCPVQGGEQATAGVELKSSLLALCPQAGVLLWPCVSKKGQLFFIVYLEGPFSN